MVLTTHDPADIEACDRVVFLARHGHLAFAGTPDDARRYFEVTNLAHVYRCLAQEGTPGQWAARFAGSVEPVVPSRARGERADAGRIAVSVRCVRGRCSRCATPTSSFGAGSRSPC